MSMTLKNKTLSENEHHGDIVGNMVDRFFWGPVDESNICYGSDTSEEKKKIVNEFVENCKKLKEKNNKVEPPLFEDVWNDLKQKKPKYKFKNIQQSNDFEGMVREINQRAQVFSDEGYVKDQKTIQKIIDTDEKHKINKSSRWATAYSLNSALNAAKKQLLIDGKIEVFHSTCKIRINEANEVLKHHREWYDFGAKLVLTVISLGIMAYNHYYYGDSRFSVFNTQSTKILNRLDAHVTSIKAENLEKEETNGYFNFFN
jgi:hypothetical protein